jgi:hypothetical protein
MRGVALVVALSAGACSTTSTIHRAYGPAYEAEIVDSDASTLRVLGDDGRLHAVSRAEVTDVDHPGNVLVTVGAVLLGIAAVATLSILSEDHVSEEERETATAVSAVYGLPGLAMLIAGGVTYIGSKSRASAFENALVPAGPRPVDRQYRAPFPPPWPPPAAAPAPAAAPPAPAPPPRADEPQVVPEPPAESPR